MGTKSFEAKSVVVGLLAGLCVSMTAFADESQNPTQSTAPIPKAEESINKLPKGPETVDDVLTNNNLRAISGSTSVWSIASGFNYNGGSLRNPLSQDRPNISQASGNTIKSDLDGSISIKYNIDLRNSLMAGFGIRWIAPLEKNGPTNYTGTVFDAMNPYVQYQYLYKWLGIQSVLQVSGMQYTQADQTAIGAAQSLQFDQENMYEIGSTGISVGASVAGDYQWFNKSGSFGIPGTDQYIPDLRAAQSVYQITIAPILEYQITDRLNFRTLISLWNYEHYAIVQNSASFVRDKTYQSIGVGYAVTRDIFLYPNVQFIPDDARDKDTNVGLSATVNLF